MQKRPGIFRKVTSSFFVQKHAEFSFNPQSTIVFDENIVFPSTFRWGEFLKRLNFFLNWAPSFCFREQRHHYSFRVEFQMILENMFVRRELFT